MDVHPRTLTHVGLTVPDLDAAITWYEDVLHFELVGESRTIKKQDGSVWKRASNLLGCDFDSVAIAHMITGNQVNVELFEFDETDGNTETEVAHSRFFHIGVIDRNIEELAQRIDETGGDHYSEIWKLSSPKKRATYCKDPYGNRIEIYTQSHERMHAGYY